MSKDLYFILFLAVVLLFPFSNFSQTMISGTIESNSKKVPNVNVVILSDGVILYYTHSDANGNYEFILDTPENIHLKIIVNALGYESQEKFIKLDKTKIIIDFILTEKVEQLNEVILEPWEKIKVKKDTITFKASAFKDGTERVVEDLLKNLPGVEISKDGSIKVNGRSIDKLLIEGDDLFDEKYKLLSKNLDAKTIEEIEILHNFEDNPILKSFQDSEKVAINLKLKEDKKNVWFGNMDVGFGTNNQYNNSANIGLLKKKIKFFNLTNINSIGQTAVSQVKNSGSVDFTGFNSEKKIEKQSYSVVNIDNLPISNLANNEDVFNKSFLNSLSFTTNLSEKIKLRNLTYYTFDNLNKQNSNLVQYFIEPNMIQYTEENSLNVKDISFATNFEIKHLSQREIYYTYDFTYENNPGTGEGDLIFNNELISQKQIDKRHNFFNHLNITKKLSDTKLWLNYVYLGINNSKQKFTLQPNLFEDIFNNESLPVHQNSSTPLKYYGLVSEIVGKNKSDEYGIRFSFKNDIDEINSTFKFGNESNIDSLSNRNKFKNYSIGTSGNYSFLFYKTLKVKTSIEFSQNFIDNNNRTESFFVVNPNIRVNSKKTSFGNFGISYGFKNNLPKAQYLTENFILRNYRSFTKGTDDFTQTKNHNLGFFYAFSDFKNQFLINSFLLHSFSNNAYGLKRVINENFNLNEYIIIDGGRLTSFSLSATKYITFLSSSIKMSMQQSWSQTPSIINNVRSELQNNNYNYRFQGTTYFELPVNFRYSVQYNYSKGIFENQISTNNYWESSLEATFKISKELVFELKNDFYSINYNNYLFSNMTLNFNPKTGRFTYVLTAKNLSNIKVYSDVIISDFQRSENSFRIVPRYLLLNVKYRF